MKHYYQDDAVTIYHGDCVEILPQLMGGGMAKFDLLLTDPPYGTAKEKFRPGQGGTIVGSGVAKRRDHFDTLNEWDKKRPAKETFDLLLASVKTSIIWGGNYFADLLPASMGWLFWDKINDGKSYANGELAWTSRHAALRTFRFRWDGMLRDGENDTIWHPTMKPVELFKWCISLVEDVQTIVDPFAGSCTAGRAAKDLGLKCVCIEREEKYCQVGAKRMEQEILQLK